MAVRKTRAQLPPEVDDENESGWPEPQERRQESLTPITQQARPTSVSIPIWEEAPEEGSGGAGSLKIQRVTHEGRIEDLSTLPAGTSQDQLVSTYKQAGTYHVMPITSFGQPLRQFPYKIVIPEDHPVLLRLRASQNAGNFTGSPLGYDPTIPKVVEVLERELQALREQIAKREVEIKLERDRLAEERDRVAQERLSLAVQTVTDNNEMQSKILERAHERDSVAQSSIVQILAQQQAAADANHVRQLASLKQEQEYRLEMIRAQMEADRAKAVLEREERGRREKEEREDRIRRDKEDQAERDAREDRRQSDEERRRDQDRAHNQAMLQMMKAQNDPLGGLVQTITKLEPVSDLLRGLLGGKDKDEDDKPKTWVESLAGIATAVINGQVEIAKARAMSGGMEEELSEEEEQALLAQQQQPQIPQQATAPAAPAQGPPVPQGPLVVLTPAQMTQAAVAERTKGMDPALQKAGRRAIKALVEQLRATPDGEWIGKIVAALQADGSIFHYVSAVGLRTASKEAGADDDLAGRITATIDASGLVPPSVPRN